MIKYIVSSFNSSLRSLDLMQEASRYLFMAVNSDDAQQYAGYNMFHVSEINGTAIMIVDISEMIQVNNTDYVVDFLNMFSMSDQEVSNIVDSITPGDKVSFQSIFPSNLVVSSYEDLIDAGLIEEDTVE